MKKDILSKSDKALLAISELEKKRKIGGKITVEDVAVALWKIYPSEFCMRGYPEFPNVDIQKHITKLLENNLVNGGVYDYRITPKGEESVRKLQMGKGKESGGIKETTEFSRKINSEIKRILNSKVFHYFVETPNPEFVESDLFEFLGTSSRSLATHNRSIFIARYNLIVKDTIPLCEERKNIDKNAEKILKLWSLLLSKFKERIEGGLK